MLYCFGFPHLAWWLASRSAEPLRAEERNLLCDHFFGGLTTNEIAEVLQLSPATIERDWSFARAWLYDAIGGGA